MNRWGRRASVSSNACAGGISSWPSGPTPGLSARLERLIESLQPETLADVIRAFSVYFMLVNIAEEAFLHRQLRRIAGKGGELWEGSFDHTLRGFRQRDIDPQQLQDILDDAASIPVFTAHPTESKRLVIMNLLRRIFVTSEMLDALLDDTPILKQSLSRRDAYLDPLNHIQLGLLRRYRDPELSEAARELWLTPLLRSINAISAGLRNTG